jgi:phosphoglycerate dehydrogenase-like enzyme
LVAQATEATGRRALVNVERGPVIDEAALYAALSDEVIAGAAIDVCLTSARAGQSGAALLRPGHPFHELPNVVLSPHRAASPIYAPERWDEVVELIARQVSGQPLINVIDLAEGY